MNEYIVNATPVLTWTWLKLNNDKISLPENFIFSKVKEENLPQGFKFEDSSKIDFILPSSSVFNPLPKKEKDHRKADGSFLTKEEYASISNAAHQSHSFTKIIDEVSKDQQYITISGTPDQPLILNLCEDKNNPNQISKQIICAQEDSESTVIFVYDSDSTDQEKSQIIQTQVYVKANAKLNIVKVQLTGKNTLHLDDTGIICEDDSKVTFTQIELGASHIDSGLNVSLKGNRAKFVSKIAYLCKDSQFIDMNHLVTQYGKRTECSMDVDGTIKDEAKKTYRGTIDLRKGCSGSKGNEMENTLILSPKAVNKSMPNILCTEEDIAAEHGSTIGRLSSDILFYMQTRGIDVKEAEQLISIAKIKKLFAFIPDSKTVSKIRDFLGDEEE